MIKQFGFWDKITGRDKAIVGLKTLKSTAGYPKTWIYSYKEEDKLIFKNLYIRIKKRTQQEKIKNVLNEGFEPYLIATAGEPIKIMATSQKPLRGKMKATTASLASQPIACGC